MSEQNNGGDQSLSSADQIDAAELEGLESGEQSSDPTPTPAEQKAIEKLERSFKLKVNGKEIEEKIDLNNEAELVKRLQLAKAADSAFQERAATKKQLEQMNAEMNEFLHRLKSNPLEILKHPELGINLEQVAEMILQSKIEEEMKSPEQIELEKAKKRLQELEDERRELAEAKQKAEMERLEQEASQFIQQEIVSAIDTGELPNSPYIVNKMAQLLSVAYDNGIDVDAKDIVPIVKQAYIKDMKEMLGKLPDDLVEELVTADRVKGIRNKRIQAVKAKNAQSQVKIQDTGSKPIEKESNKKPVYSKDFFKNLGDF